MAEERTAPVEQAAETSRAFPVPRNRPVLPTLEGFETVEHEGGETAPGRHRRVLEVVLILSLVAIGVVVWLITRPAEKKAVPAPVVEVRTLTDDPAVETYFAPSKPEEVLPLEDDRTPLPVHSVSLDELFGKEER